MTDALLEQVRAVPLLGIHAFGLGSAVGSAANPAARLRGWRKNGQDRWVAVETAGVNGRQLLQVVTTLGGTATRAQLDYHTPGLEASALDAEVARLSAAGLLTAAQDGSVFLPAHVAQMVMPLCPSLADQGATTTEALLAICRGLGIARPPTRKQDRIDVIRAAFADPDTAAAIRADLSDGARALLTRIADAAGAAEPDAFEDILPSGYYFSASGLIRHTSGPGEQALRELTGRGLVGRDWDNELWVWREAWPVLDRPFFRDWRASAPPPTTATAAVGAEQAAVRLPRIVADLDRAVRAWRAHPPAGLKNGEPRLNKADSRRLAKSLGCPAGELDLLARLAIGIGLLQSTVVAESGRGRYRSVERAWLVAEDLLAGWEQLPPGRRWVRLVAEWCRPSVRSSNQLLANRHLLLWELASLAPGTGWPDIDGFARWFGHKYAALGGEEEVVECIGDLQHLGMVAPSGPLALTELGRAAVDDPHAAADLGAGVASHAVVQADHTIIAPPDLRADLVAQIAAIALVESDAGALVYRLDDRLITQAVQGGRTAESIIAFLTQLSSVPLADSIGWFVRDAAARAHRMKVISAPTVVVVDDPVDLTTACSVRSARLTRISDTVAVSDLPHAKVQAALDRKGLTPELFLSRGGAGARPSGGRSANPSGDMSRPEGRGESQPEPPESLRVFGPLALTPALLAGLAAHTSATQQDAAG